MISISWKRFWVTFFIGWLIAGQLNWGAAAFVLNPLVIPMFDGFMRTGDNTTVFEIIKMTFGFMPIMFVGAYFMVAVDKPGNWIWRAVFVGMMMSFTSFFGSYTFISGWGNVKWEPLMITALCDTVTVTAGLIIIGFMQQWKNTKQP